MADRLQKIMNKIRKEKKETPFTTSIRIEKKIFDIVSKYLAEQDATFSDFINEYLKDVVKDIEKKKEKEKS